MFVGWKGLKFGRGVRRMRETIEIVRMILKRERVVYAGEIFELSMGLKLITHPIRDSIPIYLATLTPTGVALAGEMADGWLPVFFSPAHYDEVIRPGLEKGAEKAGRPLSDLSICPIVPVVVTNDLAAGRNSTRAHLALYIGGMGSREKNYYNQLWCSYGFVEEAKRIQDLYLERRKDEAMALISDEMVDLTSLTEPVAECRDRLSPLGTVEVDEVAGELRVLGGGVLVSTRQGGRWG